MRKKGEVLLPLLLDLRRRKRARKSGGNRKKAGIQEERGRGKRGRIRTKMVKAWREKKGESLTIVIPSLIGLGLGWDIRQRLSCSIGGEKTRKPEKGRDGRE